MLKKLSIQNFKTFGASLVQLPLSKLTMILGPNGSGKTAILEALGLLSQTAARQSNENGFHWRGKWVDFGGDGRAALHKGNLDAELKLELLVELAADANAWYSEHVAISHAQVTPPNTIEYLLDTKPRSGRWSQTCRIDSTFEALSEFNPGPNRQPILRFRVPGIPSDAIFGPQQIPVILFEGQVFGIGRQPPDLPQSGLLQTQQEFSAAIGYLREWLTHKVFLIGPDRMPRSEKQNPRKWDLSVGRFGEDTLNLLTYLFASAEHSEITAKIQHWAAVFKLSGLKAGWVRQENLRASFTDSETRTPLELQYSGFGSQQVLPLITQIFAAPKGSIIGIEEPETSLHPEAQLDLVKLFADGIRFGQQVIFTTHSSTLPLALSEAESYGLTPRDVTIYHLKRDSSGVIVQPLKLDETWAIKGWVPSFSSVEQKLLKEWIHKVDVSRAQEP